MNASSLKKERNKNFRHGISLQNAEANSSEGLSAASQPSECFLLATSGCLAVGPGLRGLQMLTFSHKTPWCPALGQHSPQSPSLPCSLRAGPGPWPSPLQPAGRAAAGRSQCPAGSKAGDRARVRQAVGRQAVSAERGRKLDRSAPPLPRPRQKPPNRPCQNLFLTVPFCPS